ncbi:MAG: AAA family ATPase [Gemmataceae bacterium]
MLSGGIVVKGAPLSLMKSFQRGIVRVQIAVEGAFESFARAAGRPAVLLCDRGVLDGAAYLPRPAWEELLREEGLDEAELRRHRYAGVIHMVSAAFGVEGAYGTHSNAVRYEDVAGARAVDLRLRQAWGGHPRLRVIDTSQDFEAKLRRVVAVASELLGVPPPPG